MPDIRSDLSQPVLQRPQDHRWIDSPQPGVARVMLDRVGDEVAVATSLVRYAPGARFGRHDHALGEEFIVLDGEFADEHGRYAAGSYLRNPPGTHHAPFSEPGCVIWVKLRQFDPTDQRQCALRLDTPIPAVGVRATELHRHGEEVVQELVAAASVHIDLPGAPHVQELLVIEGAIEQAGERLEPWAWIRLPARTPLAFTTLVPSRLFTKTRPVYA